MRSAGPVALITALGASAAGCLAGREETDAVIPCSIALHTSPDVLSWDESSEIQCEGQRRDVSDRVIILEFIDGFDIFEVDIRWVELGETGTFEEEIGVNVDIDSDSWYGDCAVQIDRHEEIGSGASGLALWAVAGEVSCPEPLEGRGSLYDLDIGVATFESGYEQSFAETPAR